MLFWVFLIAILHIGALIFGWYVKFWWFDIMNHFLGGFFISVCIFWLIKYRNYFGQIIKKDAGSPLQFLIVLFITILVALLWELYEYSLGFRNYPEGYLFDTIKDIVMGFVGGVVGASCFIIRKYNINNEK